MKKQNKAMKELQDKVEKAFNKEFTEQGEASILMDQEAYDKVKKALRVPRAEVKKISERLMKRKKGVVAPFRCKTRIDNVLHCVDANGQKFEVIIPEKHLHAFVCASSYDSTYANKWRKKNPDYFANWKKNNKDKVKQYAENRKAKLESDPVLAEARKNYLKEYYRRNKK